MYALVEIKGKQYKAEKGSLLRVDKVAQEPGEVLEIENVLMLRNDNDVTVGEPYVSGAKVKAVVESHIKDKKITIFKYKRRKNYRRKTGHRQQYSMLRVQEIDG
jgi:large subunit ribosomal protein L21